MAVTLVEILNGPTAMRLVAEIEARRTKKWGEFLAKFQWAPPNYDWAGDRLPEPDVVVQAGAPAHKVKVT